MCKTVNRPSEELHEEADIEDARKNEEETVPQSSAGVEGREIQVIIITNTTDHCNTFPKHPAFRAHTINTERLCCCSWAAHFSWPRVEVDWVLPLI